MNALRSLLDPTALAAGIAAGVALPHLACAVFAAGTGIPLAGALMRSELLRNLCTGS